METNEIAFLILALAAFIVFAVSLAWASHAAPGTDLGKSE